MTHQASLLIVEKCLLRSWSSACLSRRSDTVDPPSEHAVFTVEVLTQGAACRGDGTILAGMFEPGIALQNGHGSRAVVIQPRCRRGGGGGYDIARVTARTPPQRQRELVELLGTAGWPWSLSPAEVRGGGERIHDLARITARTSSQR